MRLAAQRSTRSVLISLAVHVAAVAGIIWVTAPRREPSLYADETTRPATGGGGGGGGFVIPLAQALTAAQATEYVGRYSIATDGQPKLDLIISSVKEAANYAERWSLLVHEGGASPYRLLPFARDSFVVRGRRERRVVFARREGNVTGIELHVSDQIRRGEKRSVR